MAKSSQFITSPETCVDEMLEGVKATFPGLVVDVKSRVVLQNQNSSDKRKVGIISGGGSGHEPFSAGFVGKGMLTAAVAGSVFASPPPSHILTAISSAASLSPGGVLVIFNNYTGDVLNFGLAMERAKHKGYNVKYVTVDEDCSIDIQDSEGPGKRGLCGCLFVIKIAGAMAEMSKSIDEIYKECIAVKEHIATFGVTIKPCNMPGVGPMFEVEEGFMELGIGIHGEAGASKTKLETADKIAILVVEKLCTALNVKRGDRVCLVVNNLGGASQLELYLMAGQVFSQLRVKGVEVAQQYAGPLVTSLDMSGVQVSMLLLPEDRALWLDCLDAPTDAPAWPGNSLSRSRQTSRPVDIITQHEAEPELNAHNISDEEARVLKKCLEAASKALQNNENKLNELDRGCGDGDTGSTLRRLADAILDELESLPVKQPQLCFIKLSQLAEDVMGGTSGALYSLMFEGASKHAHSWAAAWQGAMDLVTTYSKAKLGNRTMFDALLPACKVFCSMIAGSGHWAEALDAAVKAADRGCENTLNYKPLYGRASYVDISNVVDVDAGAFGVTVWLRAIKSQLI